MEFIITEQRRVDGRWVLEHLPIQVPTDTNISFIKQFLENMSPYIVKMNGTEVREWIVEGYFDQDTVPFVIACVWLWNNDYYVGYSVQEQNNRAEGESGIRIARNLCFENAMTKRVFKLNPKEEYESVHIRVFLYALKDVIKGHRKKKFPNLPEYIHIGKEGSKEKRDNETD